MDYKAKMVGMIGFEPTAFRPPDERANRTAPHPERCQFLQGGFYDKFFLLLYVFLSAVQ
jgi:hypothetical protein